MVELMKQFDNPTLVLNQAFEKGWVAIGAGKHVLVNNWANGWVLDKKTIRQKDDKMDSVLTVLPSESLTVSIIFWPQLLQFLGFALLPIPFLGLLKRNPKR